MESIDGPTLHNASLKFHAALTAYQHQPGGRQIGHGWDCNRVDDVATVVVEALLMAGWTPPVVTRRAAYEPVSE